MIPRNRIFYPILVVFAAGFQIVPRLVINYGMDGDSIRGVMAAERLVKEGAYYPSRLPGNPLFEYLLAFISIFDGHVATNLIVLISFAAAIAAFALLVRDLPNRGLLTALFCLTPILVVDAAATMDYVPGLAMLLWSYVAARNERLILSFTLLGMAIGLRISNSLFVFPIALLLWMACTRSRHIVLVCSAAILLGLSFYFPIFLKFGWKVLSIPPESYHGSARVLFTGYKLLMLFGPVATLGVAVPLFLRVRRIAEVTRIEFQTADASYAMELTTIAVFLLLFLLHPDESDYLIPTIPFFYVLLGRWLTRRDLWVVFVLIVSFAFVSLEFKGGESGRRHITIEPCWGVVVNDFLGRRELEALRQGVAKFDQSVPAVIITGYGPMLGYRNEGLVGAAYREISPGLRLDGISDPASIYRVPGGRVFFVSGLSRENTELLQKQGYRLYCFSESAPSLCMHRYGYDPFALGMIRLEVAGPNAFFRKQR